VSPPPPPPPPPHHSLDAAIFKALKPGGVFIVADHVTMPGTSYASAKGLHRIDLATVRFQVTLGHL
jgi:predicted methyltransferase